MDKNTEHEHLPREVQALLPYLRMNGTGKRGQAGTYYLRLCIAAKKAFTPRRYDFGMKTRNLEKALKRAGELVALCFFCGMEITSRGVDAPALANLFPLSDLSDDLGRDREDECSFSGGNAGMPFFIQWASDTPARSRKVK